MGVHWSIRLSVGTSTTIPPDQAAFLSLTMTPTLSAKLLASFSPSSLIWEQSWLQMLNKSPRYNLGSTYYIRLKCGMYSCSAHCSTSASWLYPSTAPLQMEASFLMPLSFAHLMYNFRKKTSSLASFSKMIETVSGGGRSNVLSQFCGAEPYCEGDMLDVKVTWGRKRCGESKCDDVLSMSVVRVSLRGWPAGGRSQTDEPGILKVDLGGLSQ